MFKKSHVFIGAIEKGSQNNSVKFEFADGYSKSDVHSVQPGCGCTGAIITDDGVIASFNESDVSSWDEAAVEQNTKFYPEGFVSTKEITVFLNDGLDRDIKRADGGAYPNPEKDRLVVTFASFVKF